MRYLLIILCLFSLSCMANDCTQVNKEIEQIVEGFSGNKMQKQLRQLNRQCNNPLPLLYLAEYFDDKGQFGKASNYYEVAEEYAQGDLQMLGKMLSRYTSRAKQLLEKDEFCKANLFIQRAKLLDGNRNLSWEIKNTVEAIELYRTKTIISSSQINCFITRSLKRKRLVSAKLNLSVNFELNQSQLNTNGIKQVNELIAVLKSKKIHKLTVIGHSDLSGETGYNLQLSKKRAKTIKRYLEKHLATFDFKLHSLGRGESQPIINNESKVAGKINRRVEFEFE